MSTPVSEDTKAVGEHYAYCKDPACAGCLPPDEALATLPIIDLWREMLARCIAQTPQTKTREGALAVIVADGPRYRELSRNVRNANLRRLLVGGV